MTASAANAGGLVSKHASSVQLTVNAAQTTATRVGSSFSISGSNIGTTDGTTADAVSTGTITNGIYSPGTIEAVQGTAESAFSFSQSYTQGDVVPTAAPTVGNVANFSTITSYTAGSVGDLAGTVTSAGALTVTGGGAGTSFGGSIALGTITAAAFDKLLRYDVDIPSGSAVALATVDKSDLVSAGVNMDNLIAVTPTTAITSGTIQRRLTRINPDEQTKVIVVAAAASGQDLDLLVASLTAVNNWDAPINDAFTAGGATGAVVGESPWALENSAAIPEIDIKVNSVSVEAKTKKLKAKWSPELGQDLNAYHNMDAEVELTGILSEQIALEIDQEILNDLIQGAKGNVRYWSRSAGKFVNRTTGLEVGASGTPDFTGTVSEWYETLIETVNDVSAQIHRTTVRGGANFLVCGPEVANVLEFTAGFRANVTADSNKGTAGAMNVGSISKKFDIWVDPYFPRNVVLVGRKGNSFLESGYVYAPYVPLQVTPTIFGVEDFVPRKGVMTRYGKKMVRPDMYGLVIVQDLV